MFSHFKKGLAKTRRQITSIIGNENIFNEEFYEKLEDALVSADISLDLSLDILERLRAKIDGSDIKTASEAYTVLKQILIDDLQKAKVTHELTSRPWVVLVVGVNGVGKTTTIGKVAHEYRKNQKKVMLGAVDTFRAGAIEQLKIWADRTGSDFVAQQEGSDPASVAFDAIEAAKARNIDVLILDTAGRLHNKVNLMNEMEKILRVIKRNLSRAPDEILLVIDAITGQNSVKQTEVFHSILGITGLIITKLDGSAKGGIALALTKKFGIPIYKIGVGERITDLQNFDPERYVEAMFGDI